MNKIQLQENERIDTVNEGIKLIQRTDGLTYGTDALLLSAYVNAIGKITVEFGSGTGIISLLLLHRNKAEHIYAYEIQDAFASLTHRNADINGLSEHITVINKDIRDAKSSDIPREADILITNPPYMNNKAGLKCSSDEKNIARREVCGSIADFCSSAKRLLKHGGRFYCVYRPDRLVELIFSMRSNSIEPKRMTFVHADYDSAPSLVLIEGRLGAGVELKVTRPLVIYTSKQHTTYTEDTAYIYKTGSFPEERF